MHAVVLAGGYATRLWPITRHRPKMLLPVGDRTVIDYVLDALTDDDRIDRIYLSTNEAFAAEFREHIDRQGYDSVELSIEGTTAETEKLGVVGALGELVEREGVEEDLLVVAGDNLFGFDLSEFLDYYAARDGPVIAAHDVGSRELASSYGLVELDGDRVVDFQEKPDDPKSTLVSIACYAFPGESLRFEEYLAGDNNPDEPGWFVQWLQSRESVYAYSFEEPWFDIGTPESYLDAVAWKLDGEVAVDPAATVEDCELGPNVQVLGGAELRNVTLSGSVVFPDAALTDATVERSIVDEHATVEGVDLSQARVGSYSRIR
jgi:glucose-1-phosphate thymidylyltransferase